MIQPTPNFFLVGAPKAGTTSLFQYLGQHTEIYISPVKEPNYFAHEIRFENFSEEFQEMDRNNPASWPVSEWSAYLKLFQGADRQTALGEASVCYLWSKTAPANIAAKVPDAKILMVLRDPVERAFSQYLHMLTYASAPKSFREHFEDGLSSNSKRIGKLYPFLEFGLYYEQVKRYFAAFPRQQIGIYFYEDYLSNPTALVQDMFRFLSVDPSFAPDLSMRHTVPLIPRSYLLKRAGLFGGTKVSGIKNFIPHALRRRLRGMVFRPRKTLVVEPADRSRLLEYYRDDIQKLSSLLDRDLSHWAQVTAHLP